MQLSKYYNKIQLNEDTHAIFNSYLMDILVVNNEELIEIEAGFSSQKGELIKKGIYSDELIDSKVIESIREEYLEGTKNIEVMYLILTDDCNYMCKYCYMANMEESKYFRNCMSKDTAINAMKMFGEYLKLKRQKGTIILYGGEPLLRKNIIEALLVASEEYPLLEFSIVTNGSLIDDCIAKLFKKYNVEIGVSLDGYDKINDVNRVYTNGKGTYEDTYRGIKTLEKNGCKYGLSITVSEMNINNSDELFKWIGEFNTENIAFNFMQFSSPNINWEKYSHDFVDFITKAYNALEDKGIYENTIYRKISSFANNEIKFANCASIGLNQITVCTTGDIVICQGDSRNNTEVKININNVQSIDEIVNQLSKYEWINRAPVMREECEKCNAIFICGGGCALQSEAIWGDRNKIDETFCIFTKGMLEWLIKYSYLNN